MAHKLEKSGDMKFIWDFLKIAAVLCISYFAIVFLLIFIALSLS